MKRFFLIVLCLLAFPVVASHIVGGEFELIHVQGNIYRLNLIIYFDKINGSSGAKDLTPQVSIFRKSDHRFMRNVTLLLTTESAVDYTQPECSNDGLKTDRLYYTNLITLSAEEFGDPQGYYVSWQRCCRNYQIDNIFSVNPASDPSKSAGQTFYMEFPPVVKNGQPFINSSPRLFPPLSDFGCPNKLYYVDFAGVDDDGDSLVYSLTTPLNTFEATATPAIRSGPYPEVVWRPGFSLNAIMKGAPDLKISRDGLLTVTPTLIGLFVFAVKVDEYRNKIKIGESRRDFQMLVTDGCPRAEPPQIVGRKKNETTLFDENMSVSFSGTVSDEDRSIVVRVSDPDALRADDSFIERIKIRAIPLNFKTESLKEILPITTSAILTSGTPSREFTIKFPKCPYFEGGPYQIGIIAQDDACSQPLMDTLKISVNVEPPPNSRVKFTPPDVITATVLEGDLLEIPFEATDSDLDTLDFFVLPNGFGLTEAGMRALVESNVTGQGLLKGKFAWDAACDLFNFTTRTTFDLKILVDDRDLCGFNDPDTLTMNLTVKLPGNADPIVDTDLTPDPQEIKVTNIEKKLNTDWSFHVTAKEADGDLMKLRMIGADFNPSQYGMMFQNKTGTNQLASTFSWNLRCDQLNIDTKDFFHLKFLAVDSTNKCRLRKADTVSVYVKILEADNAAPQLTIASLNERVAFSNNKLVAYRGEPINLELTGTDADDFPDKDPLTISLISSTGDYPAEGYTFAPATGTSVLQTSFKWAPDCSIFKNDIFENNYTFSFRVADQRCGRTKADTVTIDIKIKDYESGLPFGDPPNVFTPNGDSYNDYYAMEKRDEQGNLINLIPPDNCIGSFVMVQIFNRWGKQVFESSARDFKWYANNEPAGVYYYYLKFTDREYKGSISVQY